jgi:hypothetical protein
MGPPLFFGEDGALIGNGGWKGPQVDGTAELGYAVAPGRQGRGVATAVVRELVRRARVVCLQMVFAHTLAAESASASVLAGCGFAQVAELIDLMKDRSGAGSCASAMRSGSAHPNLGIPGVHEPRLVFQWLCFLGRSGLSPQPFPATGRSSGRAFGLLGGFRSAVHGSGRRRRRLCGW